VRRWAWVLGIATAGLILPKGAAAQTDWTYRARVSFEAQAKRTAASSLLLSALDSAWEKHRLKMVAALIATGSPDKTWSLRAREAYARISVASWLDIEAGKRIVRWGVGYGFAPTGGLDPPRRLPDLTDRLGRQEGMPLVRADFFRGGTSLTVAAASPASWRDDAPMDTPSRLVAARVRTILPGGLEIAFIGAAEPGHGVSGGFNVTHVVGQRLEWHGELLVQDHPHAVRALAGFQYTLAGLNLVIEYHRLGITGPHGEQLSNLFMRVARAGADLKIVPEWIVIRALNDGTWTMVAGLGWNVRRHFEINARLLQPSRAHSPQPGPSPVSTTISTGATIRF